ncbi:MAG: DUF4386 domain-containing protein [Flavobacteriales bacterium]|nr:DUF4386 domain-containing protein [Flavobacteriales bacterium]
MENDKRIARKAGLLYLTLIPLGVFGILFVPTYFLDPESIQNTIANIQNDTFLFRLSISSSLLTQVVQIFVVLALYKVFNSVNEGMAKFMVISIMAAVPIAMLNELNYFAVLESLENEGQVAMFLSLHEYGVLIAQIFWGIWLFPMGVLAYKSENSILSKTIGVLLVIACFGYLVDSFVVFLDLDLGVVLSDFTFLGEIAMVLWLLIKGGPQLSRAKESI